MTLHEADWRAVTPVRRETSAVCGSRNASIATRIACVAAVSLIATNCSQQKVGSSYDPKYGVYASPRVIRDGEPVPKGGGRELVGRPYMVAGRTYVPRENPNYAAEGLASWYGANFHGRLTANGEIFDRDAIAAAHTTMPLPSYARVTNLANGRSIVVRVNDRGPYHANRVIDVSQRTAEALDFRRQGTARVRVEYLRRASPNGSDDQILLSSLRTDGGPAVLPGVTPTALARAEPRRDVPRQALALRSYEPSPAEAISFASGSGRGEFDGYASEGAAPAPLPPERPFDLGTVPDAAGPIPLAGASLSARAPRPAVGRVSLSSGSAKDGGAREPAVAQPLATKSIAGPTLRR
jgi:rare lipoprotein A